MRVIRSSVDFLKPSIVAMVIGGCVTLSSASADDVWADDVQPGWSAEMPQPIANRYVQREAQFERFVKSSEQSVEQTAARQLAQKMRWRSFNTPAQQWKSQPQENQAKVIPQQKIKPQILQRRTPPSVRNQTVTGSQFHVMATQHVQQAAMLFKRGMPLSAREHAEQALHQFALATDAQAGSNVGTKSLAAGMDAIREAGDFLGRFGNVDPQSLQRLVDSHQTPILKNCDLSQTSTFQAADAYYEYARVQLSEMDREWPEASAALAMLAKTEATGSRECREIVMASKTCLLRAAVDCNPQDTDALLALGKILHGTGVYEESKTALEICYSINQSPEALQLLASLHHKAGNEQLAQLCESRLRTARSEVKTQAKVYQLPPEEFSKLSPQVIEGPAASIAIPDVMTASFQKQSQQNQQSTGTQSISSQAQQPVVTRDLTRSEASSKPSWAKRVLETATNPVRSIFR